MSETEGDSSCVLCGSLLLQTGFGAQCPQCTFGLAVGSDSISSDVVSPRVASLFPAYLFLEQVGQGGFGNVYRAEHRQMKREVAIKIFECNLNRDSRMIPRFEREMKVVGMLDHPGVVRAFDAGRKEGMWFIVMEFLEGWTLGEISRKIGPFPMAEACSLMREASLALEYAHGNGLIHRDVKPGNMMLTEDEGILKVLDFGLASMSEVGETSSLTLSGDFLGTVDYMAPELLKSPVTKDIRVDLYGLGATLYRILTATMPHEGPGSAESLVSRLLRVGSNPIVPIAQRRPDLPEGLVRLIERLLARDPKKRPASAGEVANLLEPFTGGADIPALVEQVKSGHPVVQEEARALPDKMKLVRHWPALVATFLGVGIVTAILIGSFNRDGDPDLETEDPKGNPPVADLDHGLDILHPDWSVLEVIETTSHVRFARFHPNGGVLVGDGVNAVELIQPDGDRELVSRENFYNAVSLPGDGMAWMVTNHGQMTVSRLSNGEERLELSHETTGMRPGALAVVPPDWPAQGDLLQDDVVHVSGSDLGPDTVWRLRKGSEPKKLALPGAPVGLFDAAFSSEALYFSVTGGFLSHPENDAIWRLDGDQFAPVTISPPIQELIPRDRGSMSLACDRNTGDLYLICPPFERPNLTHSGGLYHLKRIDDEGTRFEGHLLAEGFKYFARYGLDLSPDGKRLAIVDDMDRLVYVLERK